MVVWGRQRDWKPRSANTGARYDPASGQPEQDRRRRAPPARYGHTATWTGRRMWWSGGSASAATPAAGTIRRRIRGLPTSSVGPAASSFARSAVWTGTQMIAWGRRGLLGAVRIRHPAWRYRRALRSAATGSWSATATAGSSGNGTASAQRRLDRVEDDRLGRKRTGSAAPQVRRARAARYSPIANSWSPISKVSCSGVTAGHSALWTGSRMLIWGGCGRLGARGSTRGLSTTRWGNAWTPMSTTRRRRRAIRTPPSGPERGWWSGEEWTSAAMVLDTGGALRSVHRQLDADLHDRRAGRRGPIMPPYGRARDAGVGRPRQRRPAPPPAVATTE